MYEFLPYDADGIATRRYVMPQTYNGEPSWPPMEPKEIKQQMSRVGDDASDEANERFRDLRRKPPEEGSTADTTLAKLNPKDLHWMYYQFDFGDGWEHIIERENSCEGSRDDDPRMVDQHGSIPPQYPDIDE